MYSVFRSIFLRLFAVLVIVFAFVAALQYLYLTQRIDFFAAPLKEYNPAAVINSPPSSGVLLVLGDEASIGADSWTEQLRRERSDLTVVNSAVAYTGIIEAMAMTPNRLGEFEPDALVYQVSAGNDLMDLRKDPGMSGVDWQQSILFVLENHLAVTTWIKRQYYHWREQPVPAPLYTSPSRLLAQCPRCIAEQITTSGYYSGVYEQYISAMQGLMNVAKDRRCVVVVLPDKSQVSEKWFAAYADMGQEMGRDMADRSVFMAESYPFVQGISKALLGREGLTVVNMLPLLRQAEQIAPCYKEDSPQLNEHGQAVVMRAVQKAILNAQ